MIKRFSKHLSTWLIQNGSNPAQENVYAYGIECLTNELLSDILLFICGFFMHKTMYMAIWCMSFSAVRIFLGGYHAPTHARCILIGITAGIISLSIIPIWTILYPLGFFIITAFALMIAIYYAPIIHVNHPASNEKRQKAKKQAIAIIIFESILAFILYPYHSEISCAIITGLSVALFMAVLVICINFKSRTGGSITP